MSTEHDPNRPTPVLIRFNDGTTREMSWPYRLCARTAATGREGPIGNLEVELHHIEPDGTMVYDEIPGTFQPLLMDI